MTRYQLDINSRRNYKLVAKQSVREELCGNLVRKIEKKNTVIIIQLNLMQPRKTDQSSPRP